MEYVKIDSVQGLENFMKLLKLVIVDDEPILLQGLLNTYDWKRMGFQVAGTAQSGEQAIKVIEEVKPHVVLTDIRMKQITGLMVMEEIQKTELECLFIVLSAYRDFDYAQQACDLGAYAYLLKPIEDEKLQETMQGAYKICMERMENEAKYESWEKLLGYTSALKAPVRCFGNHLSGKRKSWFRTDNECGGAAILKNRTSRMGTPVGC